jgi:Family of unknown function (DUF5946)
LPCAGLGQLHDLGKSVPAVGLPLSKGWQDMPESVICPGCGARVPREEGPTHRYLLAAPACWRLYGEVLARRLAFVAVQPDRYPVDAYAVQHPGVPGPQASQSVLVHLVSLGLMFERGASPRVATRTMAALVSANKGKFRWLEPPAAMGGMTVVDVAVTDSESDLDRLVVEWARAAWDAWSPQHETVRRFYPRA